MAALGMIAGALGTLVQVGGTLQAGKEQEARYLYDQKVQNQQADEARAASQRDAAARYREGRLMASQQRAAIAGSGGSLEDASVIDLMNDTQDEVNLAADTEIFKGEQQARGLSDAAKLSGMNAKTAVSSSKWQAAGGLFSGISNMYSRFGQQARATAPATGSNLIYG